MNIMSRNASSLVEQVSVTGKIVVIEDDTRLRGCFCTAEQEGKTTTHNVKAATAHSMDGNKMMHSNTRLYVVLSVDGCLLLYILLSARQNILLHTFMDNRACVGLLVYFKSSPFISLDLEHQAFGIDPASVDVFSKCPIHVKTLTLYGVLGCLGEMAVTHANI